MCKTKKPSQRAALFAVLIGILIMGITLFVPPVLGSADNGEYASIIEGNGLYKLDRGKKDEYFSYASVKYGVNQYYTEQKTNFSSQNLFIQVAKGLNWIFAKDKTTFDIRFYGCLLGLYLLGALYLIVEYMAGKFPKGKYLIAVSSILIFCDTAYLTWFLSFYPESVIYPSLLMTIACILQLSRDYHRHSILFVLLIMSGGILVTISPKTMLWGSVVGGFFLLLLYGWKKKKYLKLFSKEKEKSCGIILAVLAVLSIGTGLIFQVLNGQIERTEQYHSMTKGMMMASQNPEETMDFFGINRSYSLLDGSSAYERYPAIDIQDKILEKDFYSKYGTGKILFYYFSHPDAFSKMIQLIVNQAYTIHSDTGGNYDREAGKEPGTKTDFFKVYSNLKEKYTPRALGFLLILIVLFWISNRKDWWSRVVFLYLVIAGLCVMLDVIVRTGVAGAARHLFFYNIIFDLLIFFLFSQLLEWLCERWKRKNHKKQIIELLGFSILMTGCKQDIRVQKIVKYAPVKEYSVNGEKDERETICYQFIRNQMMKNGGIYTGYLKTDGSRELAGGHEVLGESEGLMLRYAVQADDKELYREIKEYIASTLQQENYLSYRVDQEGTPMAVNACVDDLRIIRGLFEGGDQELALQYAKQLKSTNLKKGLLVDYYTADNKKSSDEMTLCYGDLIAMDYLAGQNEEWKEIQKKTEEVMLGGYLGDSFPFFQTRYQVKKKEYKSDTIFMVEALLTAYHLAEAGKCPQATIDWLEQTLNNGEVYGKYTITGEPVDKVESTAIYAICVLIGQQTGNKEIVQNASERLKSFQVMEKESEVYGAFADSATLSVHSFDNLMALLALRTTAVEKEQMTKESKMADTILICSKKERNLLEPLIKNCGKRSDYRSENEITREMVSSYKYVITTSETVGEKVPSGNKLFCIGTSKAIGIADQLNYHKMAYVSFAFHDFTQTEEKREQLFYVDHSVKGHCYGTMELMTDKGVPYSIVSGNFGYASYVKDKDLSTIALCCALRDFLEIPEIEGKFYVMIDEVYPFNNAKMLVKMGEELYENGIPYILRVMPVYDNLGYPEFKEWTKRLSYLQTKNGTIVLHEPVDTKETDLEEISLESKLMRAENALKNGGVLLYPMETTPLRIDLDFLKRVKGKTRNFESFPVDTVLVLPVYDNAEEWEKSLEFLRDKWLTVADYRYNYKKEAPVYQEEKQKEYVYREKAEVSMKGFFDRSNKILLFLVGIAVAIFIIILINSRRIYKNKFRKR